MGLPISHYLGGRALKQMLLQGTAALNHWDAYRLISMETTLKFTAFLGGYCRLEFCPIPGNPDAKARSPHSFHSVTLEPLKPQWAPAV